MPEILQLKAGYTLTQRKELKGFVSGAVKNVKARFPELPVRELGKLFNLSNSTVRKYLGEVKLNVRDTHTRAIKPLQGLGLTRDQLDEIEKYLGGICVVLGDNGYSLRQIKGVLGIDEKKLKKLTAKTHKKLKHKLRKRKFWTDAEIKAIHADYISCLGMNITDVLRKYCIAFDLFKKHCTRLGLRWKSRQELNRERMEIGDVSPQRKILLAKKEAVIAAVKDRKVSMASIARSFSCTQQVLYTFYEEQVGEPVPNNRKVLGLAEYEQVDKLYTEGRTYPEITELLGFDSSYVHNKFGDGRQKKHRKRVYLDPHEVKEVLRRYDAGESVATIHEETGQGTYLITRTLKEAGRNLGEPNYRYKYTDDQIDNLIDYYKANPHMSLPQACTDLGLKYVGILPRVKKRGLELRGNYKYTDKDIKLMHDIYMKEGLSGKDVERIYGIAAGTFLSRLRRLGFEVKTRTRVEQEKRTGVPGKPKEYKL